MDLVCILGLSEQNEGWTAGESAVLCMEAGVQGVLQTLSVYISRVTGLCNWFMCTSLVSGVGVSPPSCFLSAAAVNSGSCLRCHVELT